MLSHISKFLPEWSWLEKQDAPITLLLLYDGVCWRKFARFLYTGTTRVLIVFHSRNLNHTETNCIDRHAGKELRRHNRAQSGVSVEFTGWISGTYHT